MKKFLLLFLSVFGCISLSIAQAELIPERPAPPRLVNNLSKEFPGFLSQDEQARLEQKLTAFANETSNQVVIVIVDDIAGMEAWNYATQLGHKWGVGQGKFDNGIVVLIKPTGGAGQRDYHIAVGYGLEGAIPDLTCKTIEEEILVPNLKNGQFFAALDQTTNVLMSLAKGEYSSDEFGAKYQNQGVGRSEWIMIIVFIIIFIIFSIAGKKRGRGNRGYTIGPRGYWGAGGLGGLGRGSSGGWGGGSSGGFGGFGGGGFGGGGAGGKW